MYLIGLGATRNVAKAVSLFSRAANAGFAEGRYRLGLCYVKKGIGVKQDAMKALNLYARAADSEKACFLYILDSCVLH